PLGKPLSETFETIRPYRTYRPHARMRVRRIWEEGYEGFGSGRAASALPVETGIFGTIRHRLGSCRADPYAAGNGAMRRQREGGSCLNSTAPRRRPSSPPASA